MIEQLTNFSCPCGKRYLSYPALHTHIKRKHNGKAPGSLTVPKRSIKRGRPAIEMHTVLPAEKTHQLSVLNMLETAIVEVSDLYSNSCILNRNEEPQLAFRESHPYLRGVKPTDSLSTAICEFVGQFCLHFKADVAQRVIYFMSCLFWWLERINRTFAVVLMEDFLKKGLEQECRSNKLEYFHDTKDITLYKLLAVTLSKWLFSNGHTSELLEQNV